MCSIVMSYLHGSLKYSQELYSTCYTCQGSYLISGLPS